jgi:hypothetical protein
MTVTLSLHQNMGSNPLWVNPNVWAGDVSGNPVTPKAGQPCYLWANVANTGDEDANVTVQFYWFGAAPLLTYGNVNVVGIGGGFVSAGGSQNIVCNTPWIPVYVNSGHECLIAVCGALLDPPPPTQSNNMVDASDAQTAMHNLTVVQLSASTSQIVYRFSPPTSNTARPGEGIVQARRVPLQEYQGLLQKKGLTSLPDESAEAESFYISHADQNLTSDGLPINLGTQFAVAPNVDHDLALVINLPSGPAQGSAALYFVEYLEKEKCVGGIGVIVLH